MKMSSDKGNNLQRRQAMRRKGFVWDQAATLSRIDELVSRRHLRHDRRARGSSLDLTPTLLGIYDQIASASKGEGSEGPTNLSGNSTLTSKEDKHHSLISKDVTSSHPDAGPKVSADSVYSSDLSPTSIRKPNIRVDLDSTVEGPGRFKMDPGGDSKIMGDNENDNKKRPLSISSMSSSSTSSLPRHRKRPNLCEYSDSSSSGQLDIEKLENIQYIDDVPSGNTDDELSADSEFKHKSAADSDSQISADHASFIRDQAQSFYQSDSSLSYTPSNSTQASNVDLTAGGTQQGTSSSTSGPHEARVTKSPSRSSLKSGLISRSSTSSLKQTTHYVSHVQRVVAEIIDTERIYVKNLQDIKVGYYQYLIGQSSITREERNCLFGNVIQIHNFSCHFLGELEECGLDPVKVAECFVRNNEGFVIYAAYCTNYPSAVDVLTKVMHNPRLSELFKQRQMLMGHSLPLGAYLLKPVQRILKYHLLLQNILKHYSKNDPGYTTLVAAFDLMTGMAQHINEMKRKHEHAVRVQEIQSQLEDYDGEDFTQLGELVLEGSFRMYGAKASRQMFLFNRGVIIAKRKEDGMLSCKIYIPCATLMLVESIAKEPLNFQILPFDNPRGAHTIHARNLEQKRKWCQEIKRLILESYSSKIPDKVKQMVIQQLGKSKEEEDYAQISSSRDADPGKSHVTTPEYLERRQKLRRKSGGTTLIPEILKPQRARKMQIGRKSETPSPKTESALSRLLQEKSRKGNVSNSLSYSEHGNGSPSNTLTRKVGPRSQDMELYDEDIGQSPPVIKRPVSVQRSQSFQHATTRSPLKSEDFTSDSNIVESVAQSEAHPTRTRSFRLATRLSPIRLDSVDGQRSLRTPDREESPGTDRVLRERNTDDNVLHSLQQNGSDIHLNKLNTSEYNRNSGSFKDVPSAMDNQENINYSDSLRKRGRYASMPVLNSEPLGSPKMTRLSSEKTAYSPTINHNSISKSSLPQTKQIDLKHFFSWNKDRLNQLSSTSKGDDHDIAQNLSRNTKAVPALHDMFSNMRKSSENLSGKTLPNKSLVLTQPKPFTSSLRHSSTSMLSSHARRNRWENSDHFTKGSLVDISHLQEDPWIKSKQQPDAEKPPFSSKDSAKAQVTRDSSRHSRTQSFTGDDRNFSKDNIDWLVYANRNSLPVSGFQIEEQNKHYKYCTSPRGSEERQDRIASFDSRLTVSHLHANNSGRKNSDNTDSTASLSATTSSDTCSSPDILKDAVFDESGSSAEVIPHGRGHLSRSLSSPDSKRSHKSHKQMVEDRPASMDILSDVTHIEASEKLLKEMECYMKQSSSSSGSLSSNKFPTSIPTFEPLNRKHSSNRDSCASAGSTSSYESASQELPVEEADVTAEPNTSETFVDSIKNKFHNITSKLTGKKACTSELILNTEDYDNSPPTSPVRYRSDDAPNKQSPLAHHFSLRMKADQHKSPEPTLPTLLRESEPGSRVIGSRMANPEFDDYATFSLARSTSQTLDTEEKCKKPGQQAPVSKSRRIIPDGQLKCDPKHLSLPPQCSASPGSSIANLNYQQSDSAFSIQSAEVDSSTPEDSPREGETTETVIKHPNAADVTDTYYERRLSAALSVDDAFRDSAVYCDTDVDCPFSPVPAGDKSESVPKVPIKQFVQKLEEKGKVQQPTTMKVRQREPGAIIRQRMESLQASAEYRKSSSTSRSLSLTNSRSHSQSTSREGSRAVSEEREISSTALKEYIDLKFPMDASSARDESSVFRSRSNTPQSGRLKPAYSLGRLDQLSSSDVDSLVIMKGWVRQLIGKFQVEN